MNDMHMTPPGSDPIGYAIVIVGAIATLWTIVFSVRALVWPGEENPDHPKYSIFREGRP